MEAVILVVEDEQNIANLIRERLGEEGYRVCIAGTCADALKELREGSPDVITLDLSLPDGNGLNILRNLKADPETSRIPVVVISSSDEGAGAREMGAEDFIRKPVNFGRLFRTIKELADKKLMLKVS